MRTLIISSQKGGTGKTYTAVNLAAFLALEHGQRVLLVDLDTQGNATRTLKGRAYGDALFRLLVEESLEVAWPTPFENLHLIASGPPTDKIEQGIRDHIALFALKDRLNTVVKQAGYDYVIFDAPTGVGFMTKSGMLAASEVILPTTGTSYGEDGTGQTIGLMKSLRRHNPQLILGGILITQYNRSYRQPKEVIARLGKDLGRGAFFKTWIRQDQALVRAEATGPILLADPSSKGAADYRALTLEVIQAETNRPDHA